MTVTEEVWLKVERLLEAARQRHLALMSERERLGDGTR